MAHFKHGGGGPALDRDKFPCLIAFLQPPAPLGRGYCKKCDRKKTTAGWIVRRQAKRLCKPRGTRGEDFCLPGIAPAELP